MLKITIRRLLKKYGHPLSTILNDTISGKKKSVTLLTVKTYWKTLKQTVQTIKNKLNVSDSYDDQV